MQHLLTLAATATLFSTIGFILIGYPLYVWQRTRPVAPVAAIPTPAATVEPEAPVSLPELFAQADAIMSNSIYAADVPATPVKRRRKVSPPVQEVIATQPKKRGRPPKAKAA